jgi:hypothetical protein
MSNMGNILPLGNALYDLGSPTNQWRHLYVSNNSIYIGNVPLTAGNNDSLQFGGNVIVTTDPAGNADTSIYGNIQISGNVLLGDRLNWTPNGVSAVYQVYNASTNSLDTIFG